MEEKESLELSQAFFSESFMSSFRATSCAGVGKPIWEIDPWATSALSTGGTHLPPPERAAWLMC